MSHSFSSLRRITPYSIVCTNVRVYELGAEWPAVKWCLDNGIASQVTTPVITSDLMNALISAMESNAVTSAVTEEKVIYRILIAEDNMVNQKLAVKILEKYGHSVDIADNGQVAIDSFVQKLESGEPYDIILVSIHFCRF
jgi:osomolarity two-component system, sensor histidine kinase NIK1